MSEPPSEHYLEALQCHFTWGLCSNHVMLLQLREKLLDICPDESNPWRGHIYNLLGFLQTRLGRSDEALGLFSSASEILRGPELLVNCSDLAWLHHERGEPDLSKEYLQRVKELNREYPTERDRPTDPADEQLLPEVLAEKAWTLIKFDLQKRVAIDLFERALEEQPERVEWRSSQAIALMSAHKYDKTGVPPEELLKVQRAHEEDPENMYLSVEYLSQRVKRGEQVEEEEVAALMPRIVESAHKSYSGLKPALRYYRLTDALDMAIYWAEEALEIHPNSRYVKRCAALCYKWRVLFQKGGASKHHLLEKGVTVLKEVISLYPYTALAKEIDLADLYGKCDHAKADEVYHKLLQRRMEPRETQMLYNRYAKYLQHDLRDIPRCLEYHRKAALIHHDSFFKDNSIKVIESFKERGWDLIQAEIQQSSLSSHLDGLQCHFTWKLDLSRGHLFYIRDQLEDLLPDDSNPWKGYIYNLLGFLQTRLGNSDEVLSLFSSASEALKGPALLVNYSNLAWLHHERGEPDLSQEYLQRIEELSREYPTERDQLLPEVYAEKACTQMLCRNYRLAARLFQKALEVEERVEWRSAQVLASFYAKKKSSDFLEQLRHASERDPENLPLRAEYLEQCARSGQDVGPEAEALAVKVLQHPDRMQKHMKPLLQLYRSTVSANAAVDLATKALEQRPDSRFLKACLAMCYKWRIHQRAAAVTQELIDRTVVLLREVISLYPDSCFRTEIDLANAYARSNHSLTDAKLLYSELIRRDLEPTSKQILYNSYAKFLYFEINDAHTSTQYHLRAAEIPVTSHCRSSSIKTLQRIKDWGVSDLSLRAQVDDFLLKSPEI